MNGRAKTWIFTTFIQEKNLKHISTLVLTYGMAEPPSVHLPRQRSEYL